MANDYDLKAPQILLDDLMTLRNDVVEEGREIFASWEHAIARKEFRPCALNMAVAMWWTSRRPCPLTACHLWAGPNQGSCKTWMPLSKPFPW